MALKNRENNYIVTSTAIEELFISATIANVDGNDGDFHSVSAAVLFASLKKLIQEIQLIKQQLLLYRTAMNSQQKLYKKQTVLYGVQIPS